MIVVSNTTPLIGLATIHRFNLLQQLFGKIYISQAVFDEAVTAGREEGGAKEEVSTADWIETVAVKDRLAVDVLLDEIDLGEPEGYRRTFIDHGPPMQRLLQQVAAQGIVPTYVTQLLAEFPAEERRGRGAGEKFSPPPLRSPTPLPPVEPLNDREISILHLIATGLSNREIAEDLYLSVNTVKWYGSQIYGKLGVKKRMGAVDRARELEIL